MPRPNQTATADVACFLDALNAQRKANPQATPGEHIAAAGEQVFGPNPTARVNDSLAACAEALAK